MADRRVVITGLGVATPAGVGIEPFWKNLLTGQSFITQTTIFDTTGFACNIAGELKDFSARGYVPKDYRKAVKVMARDIEIAVAAADLAFRDSGLVTKGIDPNATTVAPKRLGCNIGAGLICTDLDEMGQAVSTAVTDGQFDFKKWGTVGMSNLTPLWLLKYLPNMLSCHVTIIHGAEGPSNCITCGDASGILSVSESCRIIQRGAADVMIAGGAESKHNAMGFLRQGMLGRLCNSRNDSPATACRPLDAAHEGTVIGEGGGLLILEELSHAVARGARIYAEVAGFGAACDPNGIDVTVPTAGNIQLALRQAMHNAGVDVSQIGLIGAHGTGVAGEDALEAKAWRTALGEASANVPAFTVTGAIGSLFAGAGGVNLAAAAMALKEQTVPPTANYAKAADEPGLNLSSAPRQAKLDYALCGSFSIGGQSAACVLKRYQQ